MVLITYDEIKFSFTTVSALIYFLGCKQSTEKSVASTCTIRNLWCKTVKARLGDVNDEFTMVTYRQ